MFYFLVNVLKDSIRVFAPATVSNVGPGFDLMGFAIEQPGDELILKRSDSPGIKISQITGDNGKLPLQPEKNTAGAALIAMLEGENLSHGYEIIIHKKMHLGSGLGSSAASAVAAVFALNVFEDLKLPLDTQLIYTLAGEKVASGSVPHADNVAPCLYGGFTLIRELTPPDVIQISVPDNLHYAVVHPHIEISTFEARKMMPNDISLATSLKQSGNLAAFIAAMEKSDFAMLKRSITDVIAEPVRSSLIPGYNSVKQAAMDNGAIGSGISGSGPTMFALCDNIEKARVIGNAMQKAVNKAGMVSDLFYSKINMHGPTILD